MSRCWMRSRNDDMRRGAMEERAELGMFLRKGKRCSESSCCLDDVSRRPDVVECEKGSSPAHRDGLRGF
jgi:hypothetical protein